MNTTLVCFSGEKNGYHSLEKNLISHFSEFVRTISKTWNNDFLELVITQIEFVISNSKIRYKWILKFVKYYKLNSQIPYYKFTNNEFKKKLINKF